MTVWESTTSQHVLIALNELGTIISENTNACQCAYETHYFHAQLMRYYYSLQIILAEIDKGRVLDIGNYPGHLQKCLMNLGYDVDGVDIALERIPDNLEDCRNRTFSWNIEWDQYPTSRRGKYDSIILLEVIEHLHGNPLNLLREMHKALVDGGVALISTPNLLALRNRFNFFLGKQTFEHPLSVFEKIDRHGSPGHQRLYSIKELVDLFEVFGFEVCKIWCIDNKTPYLDVEKYKKLLPANFSYKLFKEFWKQNKSKKGKIKRWAEIKMNPYFQNFYDSIYLLVKQQGEFDQQKMIDRMKEADPWFKVEKLQ